jgi:mannose-6-phosphate isomerase-like protein (cupin superfamily)
MDTYTVVNRDELPLVDGIHEFEGYLYGDASVSFLIIDLEHGQGPRLHAHPYEEVFIVQEGHATFTVGTQTIEVDAGQVVIVPPNTPHKFVNSGAGRLRQVDIHPNRRFVTEWLED